MKEVPVVIMSSENIPTGINKHGHPILSTTDRGKTTITYTPNAVTTYTTEEYNEPKALLNDLVSWTQRISNGKNVDIIIGEQIEVSNKLLCMKHHLIRDTISLGHSKREDPQDGA
ncbi:hypothetical protein JHK82_012359 [Glycine max]|nr:hypothetical protein JHK82_012359 [Glycine max]